MRARLGGGWLDHRLLAVFRWVLDALSLLGVFEEVIILELLCLLQVEVFIFFLLFAFVYL
jgi:hypothetical protein